MTPERKAALVARRNRLNRMGDFTGYRFNPYSEHQLPLDTFPHGNASEWNQRRIALRNRINATLKAN